LSGLRRSFALLALPTALLVGPSDASEAGDLITRVRGEWAKRGLAGEALPSRVLLDDVAIQIRLPDRVAPCGSLVVIGPRSMSFSLFDALDSAEGQRVQSVGGVAAIGSCDPKRASRVRIAASAGRGAIELLYASGVTLAPPITAWVPERTGTVAFLPQDPGAPPALAPLSERIASARRRAMQRGGTPERGQEGELSALGVAEWSVVLGPGCHRFDVMGQAHGGAARHDLDAELHVPEDGRVLARDRTDSADARLEYCAGEDTRATVLVSGSPGASVTLLHTVWPLPAHLPVQWGAPPRARIATLLHVRNLGLGRGRAVATVRGVSGRTRLAQPIRNGSCYIAIAATQGEAGRGLGVRAQVGGVEYADERGVMDQAAAVSFCAGRHRQATLEVEARGSGSAWLLVLIEVVEGAWSFER
jgi:hypothetical protein